MNINSVNSNMYCSKSTETVTQKALDKYKETYQSTSKKMDSLEISSEAFELQNSNEKISATSGKDSLGITRGDKENTFVIHFSDSAMVSRAISRGYITVNGIDIQLSDEVKEQLTKVNEQAQADREKAYNEYIMQHEMAVAEQQGETLKKAFEDLSKAFEIAAKISNGGKVSGQEVQLLIETNPQLYAMAMAAAMLSERNERQSEKEVSQLDESSENNSNESVQGVSWSDFEWKSYESQISVSMEEIPKVEDISEGEIYLS